MASEGAESFEHLPTTSGSTRLKGAQHLWLKELRGPTPRWHLHTELWVVGWLKGVRGPALVPAQIVVLLQEKSTSASHPLQYLAVWHQAHAGAGMGMSKFLCTGIEVEPCSYSVLLCLAH